VGFEPGFAVPRGRCKNVRLIKSCHYHSNSKLPLGGASWDLAQLGKKKVPKTGKIKPSDLKIYQITINYTKWSLSIPNGRKMFQIVV
jgi:hypothetical protein